MICPLPDPRMGMTGTAVLDGDEWVCNTTRVFCTGAPFATWGMFTLRLDKTKANRDSLADFLVPMDAPGVTVGRNHDMVGWRGGAPSEVFIENVRIPKGNLLRFVDIDYHFYLLAGSMMGIGMVGIARAAYEEALKYASERVIWGKPIREHEMIADKLVNMRIAIETSRLLCWKIAWALGNPKASEGFWRMMPMGKINPGSMVRYVTQEAVQIFGAYGLSRDTLVEKLARDAMVFSIIDVPNEVQKVFLAQRL
jgi:alkylation response protein AidB-like acyl-CoA dehydrogenase